MSISTPRSIRSTDAHQRTGRKAGGSWEHRECAGRERRRRTTNRSPEIGRPTGDNRVAQLEDEEPADDALDDEPDPEPDFDPEPDCEPESDFDPDDFEADPAPDSDELPEDRESVR
ncbi:hypothetical protein [Leucobacter sp. NPDC077196]|uniref:hypothetical protein n=1 Tax=Leucobacter sp. NPDC077196 TaxID=3154959 RepID=UPI00342F365F